MIFPDVEPYDRGMLEVGDNNSIYWECSGNPKGRPAVFLHGGPGSGSTSSGRRFFDPDVYRIVLLDQRGCGRSRPLVTKSSQLQTNTTSNLVHDLESIRDHLAIDRWRMLGVSWGSTLALAYAQRYPNRVTSIVLGAVTTTSSREVDWITRDVGRIFPREWERFVSHIPASLQGMPIVDAYYSLLFDEDQSICAAAAREWCAWEEAHVSLTAGYRRDRRFEDPEFSLRFARIVTHYWKNAAFLEDEQLLRDAASLSTIPGILLHGRYDVSSPLETAWRLHKCWAGSELHVLDAGHGGNQFSDAIVAALNQRVASANGASGVRS